MIIVIKRILLLFKSHNSSHFFQPSKKRVRPDPEGEDMMLKNTFIALDSRDDNGADMGWIYSAPDLNP